MTLTTSQLSASSRCATPRRYLMCRPQYFAVSYAINPWMNVQQPVDSALAVAQWEGLVAAYRSLGHEVQFIDALPGLPDMVFAANGGLVIAGKALGARFRHAERQAEGPAYLQRLRQLGLTSVANAAAINEGEGDFLAAGELILAGTGFRTEPQAQAEVQEVFGRPVVSLQLVDPRFYHLDTALAVLDDHNIAYYPAAFSRPSQQVLDRLFPDAVVADEADAVVLGLNAVSDGKHVVLNHLATGLAEQLASRDYLPIPVELSELQKAGGSVKCCTLELYS